MKPPPENGSNGFFGLGAQHFRPMSSSSSAHSSTTKERLDVHTPLTKYIFNSINIILALLLLVANGNYLFIFVDVGFIFFFFLSACVHVGKAAVVGLVLA